MKRRAILSFTMAAALSVQAGCALILPPAPVPPPSAADEPRPFSGVEWRLSASNGLSEQERQAYYPMDEGIQYLPIDMMMVMKRPYTESLSVGGILFATSSGVDDLRVYDERLFEKPERMGLAPNPWNPKGPPLGITESTDPDYLPMGGFNCSTCHTSVMKRTVVEGGKSKTVAFIIDGGSSQFAVEEFFPNLIYSLAKTVFNRKAFDVFYDDYRKRVKLRERCEASQCKDADCKDNGFACPSAVVHVDIAPAAGEEEHNDRAFEEESHSEDFEELHQAMAHDLGKKRFHAEAEKYLHHLTDVIKQHQILPSPRKKHKDWTTSLTDGAYPTAEELNTKGEVWFYLLKRLLHFKDLAVFAGSGDGTTSGLGRSNPWLVTKNMLAANGDALQKIGIHAEDQKASNFYNGPSAPINTPYIWGYDSQHWIFWSGVTNSIVERNIAQGVSLLTDFNWDTWESTVSVSDLQTMVSRYASRITPPVWPADVFGAIDAAKAERGRKVFKRECWSCHQPISKEAGPGGTVYRYVSVRSDPWYTRGQMTPFYGVDFFNEVLARWIPPVKVRAYKDEGLCAANEDDRACEERMKPKFEAGREHVVWKGPDANAFVAKPLYGVWASAPYLHNGSIPSIRQLLTPPELRARIFVVGSYEYDPKELGFRYDVQSLATPATPAKPADLPGDPVPKPEVYYGSVLNAHKTGNQNLGHEYGTCLSEDEKDGLIEFLKAYRPDTKLDDIDAGSPTCCGDPSCAPHVSVVSSASAAPAPPPPDHP